jgi:hypothetical protein
VPVKDLFQFEANPRNELKKRFLKLTIPPPPLQANKLTPSPQDEEDEET